ncbi:hypothetical protein K1719_011195 [Acacia pycnantha]|nr:hypothetical protein K1719_011195 [Acacia pycnantha]
MKITKFLQSDVRSASMKMTQSPLQSTMSFNSGPLPLIHGSSRRIADRTESPAFGTEGFLGRRYPKKASPHVVSPLQKPPAPARRRTVNESPDGAIAIMEYGYKLNVKNVIQATHEECLKCGMDGYVSKPFEAE